MMSAINTSGPQPDVMNANLPPMLVIEPSHGWVSLQLRELWRYRELLYFLTWRDVKLRYKQTVIGAAWAVIQPFMTMIVFTIFFGGLANIPSQGAPYAVWSYAGLVPWMFFANGLTQSSNSLVGNSALIKKVYFPRLVVPVSGVISGIVDFLLAFIVLIGMIIYYKVVPQSTSLLIPGGPFHFLTTLQARASVDITLNVIWLPAFLLLAFVTALGVGLWLSAMNVQFRDVRYVVPFLTQFWLFATPIAYPSDMIQNPLARALYGLNPMAGVVEGFRWALLGLKSPPGPILLVSSLASLALLIGGAFYFRRMEKTFADVA